MAVFNVSGAPFLDLSTCYFFSVMPLLLTSADSKTISGFADFRFRESVYGHYFNFFYLNYFYQLFKI